MDADVVVVLVRLNRAFAEHGRADNTITNSRS